MKISVTKKTSAAAFTLIEMIGVLAVIAILASLLIPKIFNAINDAKINNTVLSYNTVRTAVMDHYGKYGAFTTMVGGTNVLAGTSPTSPGTGGSPGLAYFDAVLLAEGIIDKPFLTKLGNNSYIRVINTGTLPTYDLDGDGGVTETTGASIMVEAVIEGVPYLDAKDVNDRLDGATAPFAFPASTGSATDSKGRVVYNESTKRLAIYIAHR